MRTQLIELDDETLVEVEVREDQFEEISGRLAKRVDATFAQIRPLLLKTCRPVVEAWKDLRQELGQEADIERAEVDLGFSFEGEGNLYVTKSKGAANIKVKLVLTPKK
ncbi:MAG: hypothetical protein F6J93_06355 [Oscillatoria sp. SIO1A7]|nr:hypothetical protein [Oscillatoria sp. SIO1A7]